MFKGFIEHPHRLRTTIRKLKVDIDNTERAIKDVRAGIDRDSQEVQNSKSH